jgi:DNA-binding transcriptional regulator GbsR (MarR family)
MTTSPDQIRAHFTEAAGHLTQTLGLGKILGQIFAHVYFSPAPRTLDDLVEELGISKGSASMAVRQLESWTALHKIWVKGDRKDYYEANGDFGRIIRRAMGDVIGEKMESMDSLLSEAETVIKQADDDEKRDFIIKRLDHIRQFRAKARFIWESPLVRALMKKA